MTTLKIQGTLFTVKDPPYQEGHILTALEANALNQTWLENIRNNMAGRMRKAQELAESPGVEWTGFSASELEAFAEEIAGYAEGYTFAQRTARAPVDPVESEAFKMARALIMAKIKEANVDHKTLADGKVAELTAQLMESENEHSVSIRKEATRRVEAAKRVSTQVLGSLNLGGLQAAQ